MSKFYDINDKQCCIEAFQLVEIIGKEYLNNKNFTKILVVLVKFGSNNINAPIDNRRVIETIMTLHKILLLSSSNILGTLWLKSIKTISYFCDNNDYITRRYAINTLYKAILQNQIKFNNNNDALKPTKSLYELILLPLLLKITNLENKRYNNIIINNNNNNNNNNNDIINKTEDLRLKLLTLIFQSWIHDLNILIELNDFNKLWCEYFKTIKKFLILIKGNNYLIENCIELLKNAIHCFKLRNVFDIITKKTNQNLWNQTWNILKDVTPNLMN